MDLGHLPLGAGLDRDLGHAVVDGPVDRGGGQGHVEGHVVVEGGEGLEVGADLVAHIAAAGGAVGAHDHRIHLAVLHQVTAGVVHDHGVGHPFLAQFVGGEAGALVAGAGFIHPHMDLQAGAVGLVNGRESRAPVHRGQPAGIAVGEHVEGLPLAFGGPGRRQLPEDGQAVFTDRLAHGHVLLGDGGGLGLGRRGPLRFRQRRHQIAHPLQGPAQVHGGGTGGIELLEGRRQGAIGGVALEGQHEAVGAGHPDQGGAPHHHRADRRRGIPQGAQGTGLETMGQQGLVDHPHRTAARLQTDGAPGLGVDVHGSPLQCPNPEGSAAAGTTCWATAEGMPKLNISYSNVSHGR